MLYINFCGVYLKQLSWVPAVKEKIRRFQHIPLHDTPEALADCIAKIEEPLPLLRLLSREEAAAVAASCTDYGEGRAFARIYCSFAGMDYERFRRAEYGAASFCGRSDGRYGALVAAIYGLLERTFREEPERIHPYVGSNSRAPMGAELLGRFGMRWMEVPDNQKSGYPKEVREQAGNDREKLEMYMDAPVGFVITYRGIENALATMWPETPDTLLIHQLQGVRRKRFRGLHPAGRRHSPGLSLFDFRKAMVDLSADVAKEAGFSRIGIRGARNNTWTNTDDDGRPHITMERADEIYDGTAQRLGFTYDRGGNWYMDLIPRQALHTR